MKKWIGKNISTVAWIQVLVATAGSLYFSEVAKFVPCKLCWFERIFMYSLVFVLATGISMRDRKLYRYVFPLSITGWLIALLHNLEYYGFIKGTERVCTLVSPCVIKYINWFGFISIPLLSLMAFTVINICMVIYRKETRKIE